MQRPPWPLHKKAFVLCSASRCIRGCSRDAASPLLTSFGRPPAAGRRAPRRGADIKRFLGVCGSRSWRGWFWAAKSESRRGIEQRNTPPPGVAASSRGGPAGCAASEGGMLQNTNLVFGPRNRGPTSATSSGLPMARAFMLGIQPAKGEELILSLCWLNRPRRAPSAVRR